MARRLSHGGGQYTNKALEEAVKAFMGEVVVAAERIKENKEGMGTEDIENWREKTLSLVNDLAVIKNQREKTTEVLASVLGARSRDENQEPESSEAIQEKIKSQVADEISNFNVADDGQYETVKITLKSSSTASSSGEMEDDLEIQEQIGLQLSETICPYSQKVFVRPMKSSTCKHRISEEGFNAMFRRGGAQRCPVAGCTKKWVKTDLCRDEEFEEKLKRYQSRKEKESRYASKIQQADDMDEDEGYTQV